MFLVTFADIFAEFCKLFASILMKICRSSTKFLRKTNSFISGRQVMLSCSHCMVPPCSRGSVTRGSEGTPVRRGVERPGGSGSSSSEIGSGSCTGMPPFCTSRRPATVSTGRSRLLSPDAWTGCGEHGRVWSGSYPDGTSMGRELLGPPPDQ